MGEFTLVWTTWSPFSGPSNPTAPRQNRAEEIGRLVRQVRGRVRMGPSVTDVVGRGWSKPHFRWGETVESPCFNMLGYEWDYPILSGILWDDHSGSDASARHFSWERGAHLYGHLCLERLQEVQWLIATAFKWERLWPMLCHVSQIYIYMG
jgi:hypothetical protein